MNNSRAMKIVGQIFLVAIAAVFSPISLLAAQSSMPTVAVLMPRENYDLVLEGLREGLGRLGYKEGRDIKLMVEDSHENGVNFAAQVAKLLESKPNVLFTLGTSRTVSAKQTTHTIPIVFTLVADPVQSGLVADFASSRNNLTGVSSYAAPLSGKRLEILKEIAPKTKKILVIVSTKESSGQISTQFLEETAKKLGVQVIHRGVASIEDLEKLFLEKWKGTVDAIFHVPSVLVVNRIESLIIKANKERLPLIVNEESFVRMGALVSYGGDFRLYGLQAAKLVAKVLKGTKPSEIPIETPDNLILTINLTTAKAIGLKIPRKVLDRADRLVE